MDDRIHYLKNKFICIHGNYCHCALTAVKQIELECLEHTKRCSLNTVVGLKARS